MNTRLLASPGTESRHVDEGFSLIDVIVATVLFVGLGIATATIIVTGLQTARENSDRVHAANIARSEIDRLRSIDASKIRLGKRSTTEETERGTFTITTQANWASIGATSGSCDNGNAAAQAYLRVRISVTGGGLKSPATADTVIAPKENAFDPTAGNIAIKISDENGSPVPDVTVTATNVANEFEVLDTVTGDDGCAFFPGLYAGTTYDVVAAADGYVTEDGDATIEQTIGVVESVTTAVNVLYTPAGRLTLFTRDSLPVPQGMPLVYSTTYVASQIVTPNLWPHVFDGVFPVRSGYQMWLGSCNDADPLFSGRPGGSTGQRQVITVSKGDEVTAALNGVAVTLTGVPTGVPLQAVHAAESSGYCSAQRTYTLPPASGGSVTFLMPYGTWTFKPSTGNAFPGRTVTLDPYLPAITLNAATGATTGTGAQPSTSPSGGPQS
jgi:Tfp pilus assembly protein PilV